MIGQIAWTKIIAAAFIVTLGAGSATALLNARNTPIIQLFQGDGRNFILREPLVYEIKKTGAIIVVPAGFVTDFASVPWAARSVVSVLGKHAVPAIVHDYLYWEQKCTRLQADLIMFDAMEEYGASWFQKHTIYRSVRLGGGGPWQNNTRERRGGLLRVVPPQFVDIPANTTWESYRTRLKRDGAKEAPAPAKDSSHCKLPP